jgi:hypothetical protein
VAAEDSGWVAERVLLENCGQRPGKDDVMAAFRECSLKLFSFYTIRS